MGLFGQPRGVRIMQADERKATRLNLLPSRVTAGPGRKAGLALIRGRAYYPARPQRSRQMEYPALHRPGKAALSFQAANEFAPHLDS